MAITGSEKNVTESWTAVTAGTAGLASFQNIDSFHEMRATIHSATPGSGVAGTVLKPGGDPINRDATVTGHIYVKHNLGSSVTLEGHLIENVP